jgi:endonuclease G
MYKLYHGGGDCSREHFRFKGDDVIRESKAKDYAHSGYDEGHMANAEDFAYNCKLEELTFRYYNCVPQTPELNRGIWKHNETQVRKLSQEDSLLVICGGIFDKHSKRISEGLIAPSYCFKVVYSLSSGELLQCYVYENDESPDEKKVELSDLKELTGINIKQLWQKRNQ